MFGDAYSNTTNIGNAIEQLAQPMIVSLIGFNMIYGGRKIVLTITATHETQCERMQTFPVHIYLALTLFIVYGLAVACTLATTVARFIALGHNGMASPRLFRPSSARPATAHWTSA